ncbi:hypothetical protein KHQ81_15765 (plasmid) [Mycoplasmatota bacterium]|nr:hypothetical protein KHQ81_15765 [Mycoplasmatota bacterium]
MEQLNIYNFIDDEKITISDKDYQLLLSNIDTTEDDERVLTKQELQERFDTLIYVINHSKYKNYFIQN